MRTPKDMLFIHQQLRKFCDENVDPIDKLWYRLRIFSILVNLFQFSKPLAFDSNFTRFYEDYKSYFNDEANFVLQHKSSISKQLYRDAMALKHFPLLLIRFKYIVRKYIQR